MVEKRISLIFLSQCLDVHMNYKNPQEGARLMYDTIAKYLREVFLARPVQKLSSLEEERALHDVFMVSRIAMGGVYVGGSDYMNQIDSHVKLQSGEENPKHLVVTGDAGKKVLVAFVFVTYIYSK